MSDSVQPHKRQPTRLHHPWDSPAKNTGVGCHFLLQCMKGKSEGEVAQSCPTLSDPMDCSPPGSSVHGIFQARVLEWGAIAFSNSWIHTHKYYFISGLLSWTTKNRDYNLRGSEESVSCSVVSNSLRPHESQHAGLPVHHQLREFTQTHVH